jgi:hypothetical protein
MSTSDRLAAWVKESILKDVGVIPRAGSIQQWIEVANVRLKVFLCIFSDNGVLFRPAISCIILAHCLRSSLPFAVDLLSDWNILGIMYRK